jgi:formaldehyde-activating enzyme
MTSHNHDIDGRFAQGWGGLKPNGVHVNVLLARRGSPTAASITTAFTAPSPGFTPVLASLGKDQPSYETLNPPTVILSKSPAIEGTHETMIFGACPVGIAQAVLDTVAEGLIEADQESIVFVSLWVDTAATDETAVRLAAREATVSAMREAILGRSGEERQALVDGRESLTHPFYGGN